MKRLVPASMQVPVKYWSDRVRGFAEPEMVLLRHLVRNGDNVVDVGGNRGVYAYHCWRLGAVVDIFEPNPVCLAALEPWVCGRQRVILHPVGLSDHSGSADLHIPIDDAGVEHDASASLEQHDFFKERVQSISLSALDDFGLKNVKFIKIDVEGHESRVLEGARNTVASSRPAMLVEIEQRHCAEPISDLFARIVLQGYHGYFLHHGRFFGIDCFDLGTHQAADQLGRIGGSYINNFLFLHRSRSVSGEYSGLNAVGLLR